MKNVDKYLDIIQEQFNASVALEDINGDYKDEWTDCYEVRCHRRFENKYEKNVCKFDCIMRAANKAMSRINSAKAKCTTASDPNRCKKTMENRIKYYMNQVQRAQAAQQKSQQRLRQFQAG